MRPEARVARYQSALRCVQCHTAGQLDAVDETLVCRHCGFSYMLERGVPIMLNSEARAAFDADFAVEHAAIMLNQYQAAETPTRRTWKSRLIGSLRPPEVMLHYNPDLTRKSETWDLFMHEGSDTRILNVGGGPFRYSDQELTLNIRPFTNVDCVGDAHSIPFADNTFDTIICVAVLEHVYDPERVVAEMIRVLKPNGRLYAEVPFIFFFHGYPSDYRRYTLEGMRRLFGGLHAARFGMTQGPVSAILQSINILIDLLVPANWSIVRRLVNGAYRWIAFPFKYFDLLLRRHPQAHRLAGGFYVLGNKPELAASGD